MITISLVIICHCMKFYFFVLRTFKIYSLSSFQICNIILLIIVAILYITSPWCIYFMTESLYLFTLFTHFAHPPYPSLATSNLVSVSMSFVLFIRLHIKGELYSICLSLFDLFHLSQ